MIKITERVATLYGVYVRHTKVPSLQEDRIRNRREAFMKQMSDKEKNAEARKKVNYCHPQTLRSLSAWYANSWPAELRRCRRSSHYA